jgi:hypothetical protein
MALAFVQRGHSTWQSRCTTVSQCEIGRVKMRMEGPSQRYRDLRMASIMERAMRNFRVIISLGTRNQSSKRTTVNGMGKCVIAQDEAEEGRTGR